MSALLLLVALGVVITVLVPSALPSRIADRAPATPPTVIASAAPKVAPKSTISASDSSPQFDFDEPPRVTELERMYPDGMWPGRASRDRPKTPAAERGPTKARSIAPIVLRELPEANAAERARIAGGELLFVIRERDGWALVVHGGDDNVRTGWVPRRELTTP